MSGVVIKWVTSLRASIAVPMICEFLEELETADCIYSLIFGEHLMVAIISC